MNPTTGSMRFGGCVGGAMAAKADGKALAEIFHRTVRNATSQLH